MFRCMSLTLYFPAPQKYTKDLHTLNSIQLFKTQSKTFYMNIEDMNIEGLEV